jgi:hypothetical protein
VSSEGREHAVSFTFLHFYFFHEFDVLLLLLAQLVHRLLAMESVLHTRPPAVLT